MTSIHLWKLILLIPPANYAWRRTKVKKPCSVCSTTSFPSFVRTLIRWNEPSRPLAFYDLLFYTALLFKETSQSIRKQFVLHHINGETQFFAPKKVSLFFAAGSFESLHYIPKSGTTRSYKNRLSRKARRENLSQKTHNKHKGNSFVLFSLILLALLSSPALPSWPNPNWNWQLYSPTLAIYRQERCT